MAFTQSPTFSIISNDSAFFIVHRPCIPPNALFIWCFVYICRMHAGICITDVVHIAILNSVVRCNPLRAKEQKRLINFMLQLESIRQNIPKGFKCYNNHITFKLIEFCDDLSSNCVLLTVCVHGTVCVCVFSMYLCTNPQHNRIGTLFKTEMRIPNSLFS